MITIEENKISVSDFNYLTDKVGWGTKDEKVVEEALNNTLYSVSIYNQAIFIDENENIIFE